MSIAKKDNTRRPGQIDRQFMTIAGLVISAVAAIGVIGWIIELAHPTPVAVDDPRIAKTRAAGNAVVKALREYAKANGEYPADLTALVPHFLPKIRPPDFGPHKWRYRKIGADAFELSACQNAECHPILFYKLNDNGTSAWIFNE